MGAALRAGLAVHYFPGMWEWNRSIVLPLILRGFDSSMHDQRAAAEAAGDAGTDYEWQEASDRGRRMLAYYLQHAPALDRFTPVKLAAEFDIPVPDPRTANKDLRGPTGQELRYRGSIPMLVIDESDRYWILEHRLAIPEPAPLDLLRLDPRAATYCWAWERFYMGMRVVGVIYNEVFDDPRLYTEIDPEAAVVPAGPVVEGGHRRMYAQSSGGPGPDVHQEEAGAIRRTWVPISAIEAERWGRHLAQEVLEMITAEHVYPNPSPETCGGCAYRAPCIAMNEGSDVDVVLEASYRKRPADEMHEGRRGGIR
ncbi:MAG: hypothetical protein QOE58_1221, partial [Actinomycetota bacterium]|nr:hypothetical protein [Actinomycetota bacterium]